MTKKLSLAELTAQVKSDNMKVPTPGKIKSKKVRDALVNRLVANEFLRNGLKIKDAYESVTKQKYTPARFTAMIDGQDNHFLTEIDAALKTAEVDKNKVLGILWVQATSVIFDFMDDDGQFLSIAELKQLPREIQALVEEVQVRTDYEPVKDENGKVMKDDDGKPYLRPVQRVHLKFPAKQTALNTIAQIGKLVGPQTVVNNYAVNVGQMMVEADAQRLKIKRPDNKRPVIEHDA